MSFFLTSVLDTFLCVLPSGHLISSTTAFPDLAVRQRGVETCYN